MKNIKYLLLDVDGTLTDGCVYMGDSGELFKAFNIKDGYGICHIARPAGITPIIITGRTSSMVLNRCKELGIDLVYQGVQDKMPMLQQVLEDLGGSLGQVAYIGDDMNDYDCMQQVQAAGGLVGAPADAVAQVNNIADYVTSRDGGKGAVREFIEWLVEA